jgi:hypothetical protein
VKLRTYLIVVLLLILSAGCAQAQQPKIVPEDDIAAFLEALETGEYHDLERNGQEVFQEGMYIPDHRSMFHDYPSEELPDGQIRYDLLTIEGEAGIAWIYLFLEEDTGKIIQYSAGEATF